MVVGCGRPSRPMCQCRRWSSPPTPSAGQTTTCGYAGSHVLGAAGAQVGTGGSGAGDGADEPLAAGVLLPSLDAAEGAAVVQRRLVTAAAVGSGHASIVPNAARGRHGAPATCRSGTVVAVGRGGAGGPAGEPGRGRAGAHDGRLHPRGTGPVPVSTTRHESSTRCSMAAHAHLRQGGRAEPAQGGGDGRLRHRRLGADAPQVVDADRPCEVGRHHLDRVVGVEVAVAGAAGQHEQVGGEPVAADVRALPRAVRPALGQPVRPPGGRAPRSRCRGGRGRRPAAAARPAPVAVTVRRRPLRTRRPASGAVTPTVRDSDSAVGVTRQATGPPRAGPGPADHEPQRTGRRPRRRRRPSCATGSRRLAPWPADQQDPGAGPARGPAQAVLDLCGDPRPAQGVDRPGAGVLDQQPAAGRRRRTDEVVAALAGAVGAQGRGWRSPRDDHAGQQQPAGQVLAELAGGGPGRRSSTPDARRRRRVARSTEVAGAAAQQAAAVGLGLEGRAARCRRTVSTASSGWWQARSWASGPTGAARWAAPGAAPPSGAATSLTDASCTARSSRERARARGRR